MASYQYLNKKNELKRLNDIYFQKYKSSNYLKSFLNAHIHKEYSKKVHFMFEEISKFEFISNYSKSVKFADIQDYIRNNYDGEDAQFHSEQFSEISWKFCMINEHYKILSMFCLAFENNLISSPSSTDLELLSNKFPDYVNNLQAEHKERFRHYLDELSNTFLVSPPQVQVQENNNITRGKFFIVRSNAMRLEPFNDNNNQRNQLIQEIVDFLNDCQTFIEEITDCLCEFLLENIHDFKNIQTGLIEKKESHLHSLNDFKSCQNQIFHCKPYRIGPHQDPNRPQILYLAYRNPQNLKKSLISPLNTSNHAISSFSGRRAKPSYSDSLFSIHTSCSNEKGLDMRRYSFRKPEPPSNPLPDQNNGGSLLSVPQLPQHNNGSLVSIPQLPQQNDGSLVSFPEIVSQTHIPQNGGSLLSVSDIANNDNIVVAETETSNLETDTFDHFGFEEGNDSLYNAFKNEVNENLNNEGYDEEYEEVLNDHAVFSLEDLESDLRLQNWYEDESKKRSREHDDDDDDGDGEFEQNRAKRGSGKKSPHKPKTRGHHQRNNKMNKKSDHFFIDYSHYSYIQLLLRFQYLRSEFHNTPDINRKLDHLSTIIEAHKDHKKDDNKDQKGNDLANHLGKLNIGGGDASTGAADSDDEFE